MSIDKEEKEKLKESLKETARRIGSVRDFWDYFVDELWAGKVDGIDPGVHLKSPPKELHLIQQDVYKILYGEAAVFDLAEKEERVLVMRLIKKIKDDLNY